MKPVILPTVFIKDALALKKRLELYENVTKRVQLDIADKEFTSEPTLGVERMVKEATTLRRDVHLMIVEPIEWLELCIEEGVVMATGHIELMSSQKEFVDKARSLSLMPGLAIDLDTDLKELDWAVAKEVDQLIVMTIRAGKEGQSLRDEGLEKVKKLREKGFRKEICVDGGVNEKTIDKCVKAGADVLAIGSAMWKAEDVKKKYQKFKELARLASRLAEKAMAR